MPSSRVLQHEGREVVPRAKIFELLVYLLERRDRVVTRDELHSALWSGRSIAENSLAQCIIELRRILGDDARNPRFIQTVPKTGYRLIAPVEETGEESATGQPAIAPQRASTPWSKLHWLAISGAALTALLIWMGLAASRSATPATFSEIAWWKLNGSDREVQDSSGNRHHGDAGEDIEWVAAIREGGAHFTGLGSGISGMDNGKLPSGSSPRTISMWINTPSPLLDNVNLFEYGSSFHGQTLERFGLSLNYDAHVAFGPTANFASLIGTVRLDDGKWHLITASYEGPPSNEASIFLDGVLADRGVMKTPSTVARTGWRIGGALWGRTTFRGTIDDVRVYNIALKLQQAEALYRCSAQKNDHAGYYFIPVGYPTGFIEEYDGKVQVRNNGKDFTGIQLGRSNADCALSTLRGADAGQDVRIAADLLVPKDGEGHITNGGPYFRSRHATPGDGIIGGTSAGYWVQLYSTGMVKVKCLNPWGMIAFSAPIAGFDSSVFHHLEVEARGETLRVWLDSRLLEFEQGREVASAVSIPPAWKGPPLLGKNDGTAGIFFGAEDNRNLMGGQQARNLQITRATP